MRALLNSKSCDYLYKFSETDTSLSRPRNRKKKKTFELIFSRRPKRKIEKYYRNLF